jgi:DNA polymerase-3 subunit alpha
MKHKEGIIFTSCCYNSEIGQAFDLHGKEVAFEKVREYKEMFGDDFRLEIMLLDFVKQKPYNAFILEASEKFKIPVHLTNDCHYCLQEDSLYQSYMLMIQKKTTIKDIDAKLEEDDKAEIFELQDKNLYMKSEQELNDKWLSSYKDIIPLEIFQQAKSNAVELANRCKGIKIDRNPKLPQIENAEDKMAEELMKGLTKKGLSKKSVYQKRIMEEYDLIKRKGFCGYFMVLQKIMAEAARVSPIILGYGSGDDALVPGRGSGVGCLCLYVLGITDVDPIKHDLLFSRFLSENRGGKALRLKFSEEQKI